MKAKFLLASVVSLALAGSAQAALIGGWDFSQYSNLGFLSLDGATLQNTLQSNHSALDPTNQSGLESNLYGTMHLDGLHGSFATPLDFSDPFQPTDVPPSSSLVSNVSQALLGFGSPAACTQGQIEGMPGANCTNVAMTTTQSLSVVFEVNPGATNPLLQADGWSVNFAAKMLAGAGTTIGVEFSPDGINYTLFSTANITGIDTLYSIPLAAGLSAKGFVKLNIAASDSLVPAIDNVGIAATTQLVPEPGTAILLLAGLTGLAKAGRRRD